MTAAFKQQFIVDNRPGAGGNLGAEITVKSPPDGYTLLLVAGSYAVNPSIFKMNFDSVKDVTPIIQLSQGPYIVAVNPSVPAKTLKELLDLAKKDPDKFAYASSGSGGHVHLATALMLDMADVKMTHVPYKGSGPALSDTVAGHTQVVLGSAATTIPYIKNGRLRALAVTTAKRIPALPDVPTVAEAGVPGYDVIAWHGIVGPKGLPQPIVAKLNAEMNTALKCKELIDLLATDGLVPAGGTPDQLLTLIRSDIDRWRVVAKKGNIKPD